jgi:hypothetical protein
MSTTEQKDPSHINFDKIKVDGEWVSLEDLPVKNKAPCNGCTFLKSTSDPHYLLCTYTPPPVPHAYWQYRYDVPYKEPAGWINAKSINGPFTPDAVQVNCQVKQGVGNTWNPNQNQTSTTKTV